MLRMRWLYDVLVPMVWLVWAGPAAAAQVSHLRASQLAGRSKTVLAQHRKFGGLTVLENARSGWMAWRLDAAGRGDYFLQIAYASGQSRPCRLEVNGKEISKRAVARKTGGWGPEHVRWEAYGPMSLAAGEARVQVSVENGYMPHFSDLMLVPDGLPAADEASRKRELAARQGFLDSDIKRLRTRLDRVPDDIEGVRKQLRDVEHFHKGNRETPFIIRTGDAENVWDNRMFGGSPSPFESLVAFHRALKARGTDLIVVPCPNTTQIYAHRLMDGVDRDACIWPAYTQGIIKLLENGVEVVDLVDQYRAYQGDGDPAHFFDHHWGSAGMAIAAKELKKRLARYDFAKTLAQPERFSTRDITIPTQCELLAHNGVVEYAKWNRGVRPKWLPKKYTATQILHDGAVLNTHERMRDIIHPVLIMGDSAVFHLSWQHGAVGAGVPEHVSRELGFPVAQRAAAAGASITPLRFAREFARQSPQPRVVIFAFVTYEFCVKKGGGWLIAAPPPAVVEAGEAEPLSPVKVLATVQKTSRIPDPKTLDYADALGVTAYKINRKLQGLENNATILGLQWALRDRQRVSTAQLAPGQRYELQLIPWQAVNADGKLASEQMLDDTGIIDAPMYWVLSARKR